MKTIDIGLIQARRARLGSELERYRDVIKALEAKVAELDVAERVFSGLSLEGEDDVMPSSEPGPSSNEAAESHAKPPGLPTVPQMIVEALRHAHALGAPGLEPVEITSYIRGRYWPSVRNESISPIVWRTWVKYEKLVRHGALYALPESGRVMMNGSPKSDDVAAIDVAHKDA